MKCAHAMVDLETLSTENNAVIVSIGIALFDEENVVKQFYLPIDLSSYDYFMEGVFHISTSTVLWWMKQSDEARKVFSDSRAESIKTALPAVKAFLETHATSGVKVWGNGSDFDNVILANAYKACEMKLPWKYYNNRCYRTVKDLCPGVPIIREGTHHNALDDAVNQAKHLIELNKYDMEVF